MTTLVMRVTRVTRVTWVTLALRRLQPHQRGLQYTACLGCHTPCAAAPCCSRHSTASRVASSSSLRGHGMTAAAAATASPLLLLPQTLNGLLRVKDALSQWELGKPCVCCVVAMRESCPIMRGAHGMVAAGADSEAPRAAKVQSQGGLGRPAASVAYHQQVNGD